MTAMALLGWISGISGGNQAGIDVVPQDFDDLLVFAAVRHDDIREIHVMSTE